MNKYFKCTRREKHTTLFTVEEIIFATNPSKEKNNKISFHLRGEKFNLSHRKQDFNLFYLHIPQASQWNCSFEVCKTCLNKVIIRYILQINSNERRNRSVDWSQNNDTMLGLYQKSSENNSHYHQRICICCRSTPPYTLHSFHMFVEPEYFSNKIISYNVNNDHMPKPKELDMTNYCMAIAWL